MDINNVVITGNLGKDIELKKSSGGKDFVSFSICTSGKFNQVTHKPEAQWVNCTAWGQTASYLAMYAKKGMKLGVAGQLLSYQREVNGKRYDTYFVSCEKTTILDKHEDRASVRDVNDYAGSYGDAPAEAQADAPAENVGEFNINSDDLPF